MHFDVPSILEPVSKSASWNPEPSPPPDTEAASVYTSPTVDSSVVEGILQSAYELLSVLIVRASNLLKVFRSSEARPFVVSGCSLIAAMFLACVQTRYTDVGLRTWCPYLAIVAFMYSVGTWAQTRVRGTRVPLIVLTVAWLFFFARSDYYIEVWQNSEDPTYVYEDKYWRWSGDRNMHRLMVEYDSAEEAAQYLSWKVAMKFGHFHMSGERTPSGKKHGKWVTSIPGKFLLGDESYSWYWYGEEVSEGEFVLRSK